jgi:hypothetical protein
MKNDYKFIIGLRLYLISIHYSILVGYIYGNFKNYNIYESIMISAVVGILSPFFIPFHYIVNHFYKDSNLILQENIQQNTFLIVNFRYPKIISKKFKPVIDRV